MKLLSRRSSALALSLAVLSGCGVFAQPSAVSSKGSLVTSKVANAQAGALEVSLLTAPAQRKILAVVADIASYRVTLTGGDINGSLVKTAPAPSNGSNKVATRFENLTPGSYTMKVEALDASGNVIGSSTQTGVVTAGKCTYIDLNIKLSDTLVTNSKGHLGARVTIEDGNVVERPIEDCPANDGFTSIDAPCVSVTPTPSSMPTMSPVPSPTPSPYTQGADFEQMTLGPDGFLYLADYAGTVGRFSLDGTLSVYASGFKNVRGVAFDKSGNLYVSDYGDGKVFKLTPDGTRSEFATGFSGNAGLAFDSKGNLYVANYGGTTIDRINPDGVKSVFATNTLGPLSLTIDGFDNVYWTGWHVRNVEKISQNGDRENLVVNQDGVNMYSLTTAPTGDIVFGTANMATNGHVYRVSPEGIILGVSNGGARGIAFDARGELFSCNGSFVYRIGSL